MINANELRIGNYLNYPHLVGNTLINYDYVTGIFDNESVSLKSSRFTSFDLGSIKPIPITEEWLIKFGFTYNKSQDLYYHKSGYELMFVEDGYIEFYLAGYGQLYKLLKHIHQLQNLYFALTGEELHP